MEYVFEQRREVILDIDFQKIYNLVREEDNTDITDDDDIYTFFGDNETYYLDRLFPDSGIDFSDENNKWALDSIWGEFGKWLDNRTK